MIICNKLLFFDHLLWDITVFHLKLAGCCKTVHHIHRLQRSFSIYQDVKETSTINQLLWCSSTSKETQEAAGGQLASNEWHPHRDAVHRGGGVGKIPLWRIKPTPFCTGTIHFNRLVFDKSANSRFITRWDQATTPGSPLRTRRKKLRVPLDIVHSSGS